MGWPGCGDAGQARQARQARRRIQPENWWQNSEEAELRSRGSTILRTFGSEALHCPEGADACWVRGSHRALQLGLGGCRADTSKELRRLRSQVSGDLFSRENRRAAAVDPGEGALLASGPTQVLACGRGRKGCLFSVPELGGARQSEFFY